jgi:membrane-associated phospholipid phosphatase
VGWLASRTTGPARLALVIVAWFGAVLACAVLTGHILRLAERPGGSTSIDASITSWVVAHRTDALTTLARVLSTLGSQAVLLPVTATVAALLIARRRFVPAALLVVAWGGAIGLYNLTKHFVHRHRPPMHIWLTKVSGTSFPSGHATQSLATFLALALVAAVWLPRARGPGKVLAVLLGAGVGWSRVYLGVHWATDVGAGWLIAAAWIAIAVWMASVARGIA